ncbi:unnamed protein product, partial [Mesorhabditis belari]|uniref:RRM domain-containing protein n=1 Tax=Mesorhabditis belari TaxID=2138241 RepID=A0AAF3EJ99_9BILA
MELLTKTHLKELEERAGAAALMMQPATAPASWNGQIMPRVHHNPVYSCKLFIGGIPYDVSERLLYDAFAPYGRCRIEWPGRGRIRGVLQRGKTVGYIYVVFDEEKSAKQLLKDCKQFNMDTQDLYFTLNIPSASGGNTRQVQVIPWVVSDANYVHDPTGKLDPKKTIFVGGLHGMLTAEALFTIMNQTFGDVIYVGIDTDKYKYPIGSGRVTFSSYMAFFQAVGSAHLAIRTNKFLKRIQIDPFLEEALCMMCKKANGQVFCTRRQCFSYFCLVCWQLRHNLCGQMADHKALTRHTPREATPFDTMRWLNGEQMTIAMQGMARPFEIPQRNIFGHALGFGTAPSLAAGMGGVDLQPYAKIIKIVSEDEDEEGWTEVGKKEEDIGVLFPPKTEITLEALVEKFNEKMAVRGRKTTNRKNYVRILQELYNIAQEKKFGSGILVKILFNIVSALFELTPSVSDCMDFSTWNKALIAINSLVDLLIDSNVHLSIRITEEDENVSDPEKPYKVNGSVLMSVQRLDTELTKILQNADCHSTDYIEKLKGEKDICSLIEKIQKFIDERIEIGLFENDEVCKIYMLRIEHMYYKYEDTFEQEDGLTASQLMERLCKRIYALDDEKRLRQRAMLCHVYFLALHDEWHKARDLMLMSHLQAIVDHSDVSTQILYNRTICQLGLCAFRHGHIKEAHQGLSEIQNTQRSKELLAQGIAMRQYERTQEQEKLERSRQVPYHMHINIELMECVYLICSMLLEIPHMASHEFELRKRLLSRSFHYQLKQNEKSSLVGPPENTREHVVAASRAMLAGDWKKCRDYIVNDKMNAKVWNLFRNADVVKNMVKLAALFELDERQVHAIISKMIIAEELAATLDEPTGCVMMHRVEPSRLQLLALHLTDKLHQLAEQNEQVMEPRGPGGRGYAGPGAWFAGRGGGDRGDDKKKMQTFQPGRGGEQRGKGGAGVWGSGVGGGAGATGQRRRAGGQNDSNARKGF